MNLKRWFWNDDTARWKSATRGFLVVSTVTVLIVVMLLLIWVFWLKGALEATS